MLYDILQFETERQQTVYMTNSTNFSDAIMVINSSQINEINEFIHELLV